MPNSMTLFTFSVLEWKHPFWANWIPKINCQFKLKFGTKTKSKKQNSIVNFFCFRLEAPFLGKFGPKIQNCQFNLKLGIQNNSNMQNSVMVFSFFCFRPETPFLGKFRPKNENIYFKLKHGIQTNSNMQNSMVVFSFSV